MASINSNNAKQQYKSKTSIWLALLVLLAIVGPVIPTITDFFWFAMVYLILFSALLLPTFLNTRYTITDDRLHIKSGFLYQKEIPVSAIRKIVETGNMASAPALSLDRLEIFFGKFDTVLISPIDKTGFISSLKSINPMIEVQFKKPPIR
jgi:hypothetical protein